MRIDGKILQLFWFPYFIKGNRSGRETIRTGTAKMRYTGYGNGQELKNLRESIIV